MNREKIKQLRAQASTLKVGIDQLISDLDQALDETAEDVTACKFYEDLFEKGFQALVDKDHEKIERALAAGRTDVELAADLVEQNPVPLIESQLEKTAEGRKYLELERYKRAKASEALEGKGGSFQRRY